KDNEIWVNETIIKIREKISWVSDTNQDKIPYTTDEKGDYDDRSDKTKDFRIDDGINWWTNGFWGGIMWLLYQDTKEEKYIDYARRCEHKLEKCFDDYTGLHHDLGFMYHLTSTQNYKFTNDERAWKNAMHAANLLAGRFNPVGKFIRAWNDLDEGDTRGWAIIDCMMNISLLYWATEESADPRFKQIAMIHADKVLEHFIRPDGSVKHIVEFNPETGEEVTDYGGQGYEKGSSWTRGQGWAVYGFVISYIRTNKQEYLDAAKRVAHYCIANLGEDGIVPVDYRQPVEPAVEDSCGALIIANGLIEISRCVPVLEKDLYLNAAIKILKAIEQNRADWSTDCDAIVQNCTGAYHSENSIHITMNYADYYFVEAIYKLAGEENLFW
ncbi:MAG: glycoside hydrolase family 88 protein, partial [Coprobacillaceae bacterium]